MEKRSVKEMGVARETVYGVVGSVGFEAMLAEIGYEVTGRGDEGLILRDKEADTYVVLKAIAKSADFDAEDAMEAYVDKIAKAEARVKEAAAKKAKREAEKEAKAKAKAEKEAAKEAEVKEEDPETIVEGEVSE